MENLGNEERISPEDAIAYMTDDTLQILGQSFVLPTEEVGKELDSLSIGSRMGLEALGVLTVTDSDGGSQYNLTPYGWDVAQVASTLPPQDA